jgi:hypothetical protein
VARHSFWVIVDGGIPTSFRSSEREDLVPTLAQLKRTQPNCELKWFERGKLWTGPGEARDALIARRESPKRPGGWRPGGDHVDPRAKYERSRDERRAQYKARHGGFRDPRRRPFDSAPGTGRPPDDQDAGQTRGPRDDARGPGSWPRRDRPPAGPLDSARAGRPQGDRPWRPKRPWGGEGKPGGDRPRGDWRGQGPARRGSARQPAARRSDRHRTPSTPRGAGRPPGDRPWRPKRPWGGEGMPGGDRPRGDWRGKDQPGGDRRDSRPRGDRPPQDHLDSARGRSAAGGPAVASQAAMGGRQKARLRSATGRPATGRLARQRSRKRSADGKARRSATR